MAEPLTIIGAVAAVSQVTGDFVKLTTKLRHYLKVISRAPKEAQAFLLETSNFTGLLNFFADLADRPVQGMDMRARKRNVKGVKEQGKYICARMKYLVDRFAKLAREDMTQLESLLERIKYLLDKPDIEDLRLAIQSATVHLNTISTLLMWEQESENSMRRQVIQEQLGNLLPMVRTAGNRLAEHQRQHGSTYESGMPGPNNPMLAASREIQRQVARVVKPHSRAETSRDRSSGRRRKRRGRGIPIGDETSDRGSRPLPSGPGGPSQASASTTGRHSPDSGFGAWQHSAVVQPGELRGPPPPAGGIAILPYDSAGDLFGPSSDRSSSDKGKSIESNKEVHEDHICEPGPGTTWELDTSDPKRPRIYSCYKNCVHRHCSLCGRLHCSRRRCSYDKQQDPRGDKTPDSNKPSRLDPLLKSEKATGRVVDPGSSYEGAARYLARTVVESEGQSGLSDGEINSIASRPLPSSKSSSPSRNGACPPGTAKNRKSTGAGTAEAGLQVPPEWEKEVPIVFRVEQPQPLPEQEQHQHSGAVRKDERRLETRDKRSRTGRWQEAESSADKSPILNDSDASSGQGRPNPYVPMAPFGGPGGRRRPRRPRPETPLR